MGIANVAVPRALGVGLVVGGVAAAASLQPTFSDRSRTQQALVTGVAAAGGIGVGTLLAKFANKASGHVPGGAVATFAALAAGGVALQAWSNAGDGKPSKAVGAFGSTGTVLATVGAAGLGVLGARLVGAGAAKVLPSALAGGRVAGAVHALAGPVVLGAGVGAAAWAMHATDPTPAQPPSRVTTQAKAAGAAVASRPVSDAAPELLPTVSGGPRSSITPEEMGKHGRRFVHEAVPGTTIRRTMGAGVDPIRVYAGLDSGDTPQVRVDKAMADAERLGVFDGSRDQVVLVTPTGSGFVDPPSIQAAEFMSRGRIASIAIQYADKPSIQSTGKVPLAAETTRMLAEAVKARVARMPEGTRPEVELFGESLGAWSQQEMVEGKGVGELSRLGVDRSLWVGSPQESGFPGEALAAQGTPDNPGALRQFDRIEEVDALDPAARSSLRHVLLTHRNDPVSVVNKATLGFQRPDWLPAKGTPPNGIPASMHYVPGVSLAQGLVDLINGTHPVPGKFEAHAHDYRADLPEFVRVAYGHATPGEPDAVSDAQVAGITQELIQLERERAAILHRDPSW